MTHVHKYTRTENLGDAIQTLALLQLMDRITPRGHIGFIDRDNEPDGYNHYDDDVLCNGFLDRRWTPRGNRYQFCGIHCADNMAATLVHEFADQPFVPCRDPHTVALLKSMGCTAELVGCATLTLPRYTGERRGLWSVDCTDVVGATALTHRIPADLTWAGQIELAHRQLDRYQRAEAVWTSRLHVLLPCIAFGTPVCLTRVPCEKRFGIARALGVEPGGEPRVYEPGEFPTAFATATAAALQAME